MNDSAVDRASIYLNDTLQDRDLQKIVMTSGAKSRSQLPLIRRWSHEQICSGNLKCDSSELLSQDSYFQLPLYNKITCVLIFLAV